MGETIPHWLSQRARLTPGVTAVESPDGSAVTFEQLAAASRELARKLAGAGVQKGMHVGILSGNHTNMVQMIHALSYLGAVSVLLNTRLTASELHYQVRDADATLILTSDALYDAAAEVNFSVDIKAFSEIEQAAEKEVALQEELNLNDLFTIIYTSGTTGFPKGVMHTYGNHWWSAIGSALNLGLAANDKWLSSLPIFHVGGLSVLIRSTIYGIPVFLLEKYDSQVMHDALINKGVTIASVVTVMLQELIKLLGDDRYPETVRCFLLGGGPAPRPLLETAKTKNIPVFQSYGMTETASQIVTLSPKDALEKIGSAGKPLFPAQLKIAAKPGEVGEIHVKGPMVTKGYFKNPAATTAAFEDGWLATGDLGYTDEEGFLYVADRRNDLIISGGENIYPSEIESVLYEMEEISEVGVAGMDDATWGQVPAAFIVKNKQDLSAADVLSYARRYLASYKIPKRIYFTDRLPRNASNKLVRYKLAKWVNEIKK